MFPDQMSRCHPFFLWFKFWVKVATKLSPPIKIIEKTSALNWFAVLPLNAVFLLSKEHPIKPSHCISARWWRKGLGLGLGIYRFIILLVKLAMMRWISIIKVAIIQSKHVEAVDQLQVWSFTQCRVWLPNIQMIILCITRFTKIKCSASLHIYIGRTSSCYWMDPTPPGN